MDWNLRFERAPDIEVREVTHGYVAYDPARDRLHFLNDTAAMLLEMCDGKLTASQLPEMMASAYRLAEPPTAEVERCIGKLVEQGLLRECSAPLAR
jgi:hypothetical protein